MLNVRLTRKLSVCFKRLRVMDIHRNVERSKRLRIVSKDLQGGIAIRRNVESIFQKLLYMKQYSLLGDGINHAKDLWKAKSDEAHFWLNGYVNKQNCRIWSEANPQVYVETQLHPEKLTVWCALWAGGILLQKR
ncbi:hypothetical protein TNCV_3890811 [Trichonephila clavipes]|nr:hypothetical protein TNCV_3890811 [Trichonephila clavipes]